MKIVILDHPTENPGEICWSDFDKYGEVTRYPRTLPEQVVERIGDAEIVFLNRTVIKKTAYRIVWRNCFFNSNMFC